MRRVRAIDQDGFHELWPILFLQRALPTAERANAELERLILARESERLDQTTAYRDDNLFALDNPAVAWLRQCIHKTAIDYCRRAGMDYAIDWTLHGWANVNRLGDYHDPHNHPHAYLSGTYYVRVPTSRTTPRNRSDVRPGCITFYDPRVINMTVIRDDPQSDPEHTTANVELQQRGVRKADASSVNTCWAGIAIVLQGANCTSERWVWEISAS